jgi:hypothetical protein
MRFYAFARLAKRFSDHSARCLHPSLAPSSEGVPSDEEPGSANVFCEEMCKRLEFKSESERLADILKWAEGWQSENLIRPHTQMSRPNWSGPLAPIRWERTMSVNV